MTDERRDDEIIGRALARAIETIDVNQTPYERSRVASAPARRSIFGWSQLGFAVVGIILAVALGSWLTRPTESQPGAAASPTASASPVPSVAPTASAVVATSVPTWVYFPRDGLPPVGAFVSGYPPNSSSREIAIDTRIGALRRAGPAEIPAGATNPITSVAPPQGGTSRFGLSVRIQDDLATVEFDLSSGWGVHGSAQSQALLQQLVYTITEEPGINRALITETGKPHAVIDQLVVDKPLTRDDVSGYGTSGLGAISNGVFSNSQAPLTSDLTSSYSVDTFTPGLTRFVIQVTPTSGAPLPPGWIPTFDAQLARNTSASQPGKATLTVRVAYGRDTKAAAAGGRIVEPLDRSPLRSIDTSWGPSETTYRLALDDARPWRVFTLQQNPSRIVVDVGGAPQYTSDRIAIYRAQPVAATPVCSTTCDIQLSGAARVFEANVVWRVKDSAGKVIANGHFLASLGSSAVWGTFDTDVQVPPQFTGNVTLEVYEASPKDGSEQGLVQIPLVIR
jgi:hypothetical protein